MQTLKGLATARGLAAGPVFMYRGYGEMPITEYVVELGREGEELMRFKRAVNDAKRDLETLIEVLKRRSGREDVKVFECHEMLLEDPMVTQEVTRCITSSHLNAEAAVRRTIGTYRAQFERMNDAYFRSRVRDIDDVERRLLKSLTGCSVNPCQGLKVPSIIIADDLTPSETLQLPQELVLGFATNGGSSTSHVALLARAMGIPAVTGLVDVTSRVSAEDTVLLDGTNGFLTIAPDEATSSEFSELLKRQQSINLAVAKGFSAGTMCDGEVVPIYANVHPGVSLDSVRELGARGIGLYRSEYLWLSREGEPTEDEQFEAYRQAAEFVTTLSPSATITIRALDIGGDKLVRGISQSVDMAKKEQNPFLGQRSIRYLLAHRDVMHTQLRAVLRASAYGKVRLMYPMVSCVDELKLAADTFEAAKRSLDTEGVAYDHDLPVGIMIEVPAAALNADALARHVKFFSIGTNDLIQYTMAADRTNDAVSSLYQPLNPAVLKLMEMTVEAAKRNHIGVSVCGESASDPTVGVLWAAMGIDTLSMSATYIPVMAKFFSCLTRRDMDEYLAAVREAAAAGSTAAEISAICRGWMRRHVPDFDLCLA